MWRYAPLQELWVPLATQGTCGRRCLAQAMDSASRQYDCHMLSSSQAVIVVRTPGVGGGLYQAGGELLGVLESYANARIVSIATYPVKNPFGAGDIAVEVMAVIEHDGVVEVVEVG